MVLVGNYEQPRYEPLKPCALSSEGYRSLYFGQMHGTVG